MSGTPMSWQWCFLCLSMNGLPESSCWHKPCPDSALGCFDSMSSDRMKGFYWFQWLTASLSSLSSRGLSRTFMVEVLPTHRYLPDSGSYLSCGAAFFGDIGDIQWRIAFFGQHNPPCNVLIQKKFHKCKREVIRDDLDLIEQVMGPVAGKFRPRAELWIEDKDGENSEF